MNPSHYPSLELCKRLTETWFPKTEKIIEINQNEYPKTMWNIWVNCYYSPNIAELLDELPWEIEGCYLSIVKQFDWCYDISYQELFVSWELHKTLWTLPNALAEMWLWLKENNYLPK
jgi:hypothetical protein